MLNSRNLKNKIMQLIIQNEDDPYVLGNGSQSYVFSNRSRKYKSSCSW